MCLNPGVLSLGHTYNLPRKNSIPFEDMIVDIEFGLISIEEQIQRSIVRNEICYIMTNFKHRPNKLSVEQKILSKQLRECKLFLNEHDDIMITRADKGNITVVMDQEEYRNKMQSLLNDTSTYKRISKYMSQLIQNKTNTMLMQWEKNKYIEEQTGKFLRTYNGTIPKIYGLPKIHKPSCRLRPIVSYIGSPLYNLSKFKCNILNNIIGKTGRTVKNSYEFKSKIENTILPPGHSLISLDVISLFTNTPSDLVIQQIEKKWDSIKIHTSIPKSDFIKGIELILGSCYFSYAGEFYQQIHGSPMGSPVSGTLSELVLEELEEIALSNPSFQPLFYYRYVDDCIAAVPTDKIDEMLQTFNSFDRRLQFTVEVDKEMEIAFLDVKLSHNTKKHKIITDWFQKETWSGRYMSFTSNLPTSYKHNSISILTEKIFRLSHKRFFKKNFKLLRETLKKNGYPLNFINKQINATLAKLKSPSPTNTANENTYNRTISVPFIPKLFHRIRHTLEKSNIRVVGKPDNTLKQHIFSKLKDRTPIENCSSVCYKVSCKDCNGEYIGETRQYLHKRIKQHQYHSKKKNGNHSGLTQHAVQTGHNIDWTNYNIIAKESNTFKRKLKEAILIKKSPNNFNIQTDSYFIDNAYNNFIHN